MPFPSGSKVPILGSLFGTCLFILMLKPSPLVQRLAVQWLGWLPRPCHRKTALGFTLAELLIALAILGVIATFAIPKIMAGQQSSQYNAAAKEVAGMLSQAYQNYRMANSSTSTMRASDLSQYFNYVKIDMVSNVDAVYGAGSVTCAVAARPCFVLHNGGALHYYQDGFCNGSPTGLAFDFDPDGIYSGTTNGPGKSVRFFVYQDGRITTEGTLLDNTVWNGGGGTTCNYSRSAIPGNDPPWFSWN